MKSKNNTKTRKLNRTTPESKRKIDEENETYGSKKKTEHKYRNENKSKGEEKHKKRK